MRPLWWMRGRLMEEAGADGGDGGGGGAPAFDPVKFRADFMADVKKLLAAKPAAVVDPPKVDDPPDPDPKPGEKKDPHVLRLEKELSKLRGDVETERKKGEEKDNALRNEKRSTTLTNELGKLGIQPDKMKSALRAIDPDIRFSEDGSLVGDDDSPLIEYLASWIKGNEHFLPAKNVSGAGASAGQRGQAKVDMDDIKPGMKPDELQRVRAEIARIAGEAMGGR